MELREIQNKEEWEGFLLTCSQKTFLHSWNWGEFNKAMSSDNEEKIWRFGIYNNNEKLIAAALVIKISARRGTFLFIPHGPVIIEGLEIKDKKEILKILLFELKSVAEEEKASFIRISPIWPARFGNDLAESDELDELAFKDLGFRPSPIHMHAEATWELDITLPEEDLLMNMRKTTRYLIRQAEKNPDIEIVKSSNIEDLKLFWPVYMETAKRHHFVVFSKKYLETEFKVFSNEILLFLGKYKGEVVSAAIFVFWQDVCFYHHSGSVSKYNKIPVSYLLQWEAIKEAKNKGCRTYNFWGITPISAKAEIGNPKSKIPLNSAELQRAKASGSNSKQIQNYKSKNVDNFIINSLDKKHPWYGLSMFKIGFGGQMKKYIKTQDYIISNKYWLNYIIETIRKRKRGL